MSSEKYVGYVNTNNSNDLTVHLCNEMMGWLCHYLGPGFETKRSDMDVDIVAIRYPLSNTYFIVQFDEGLFGWHIIDSNCKNIANCTEVFKLDECVRYIKLHKFGRSMPAYFSYATA